ncbi:MAG: hypothetical protein K9M10_02250 [Candidatus Pacebacteria bacterium]|nr:hypothetical protein [Candidatus Paceibacterota bacterium]MCF7857282.1 hypothetical protein [Candidatus Paceibacterota bacterium]
MQFEGHKKVSKVEKSSRAKASITAVAAAILGGQNAYAVERGVKVESINSYRQEIPQHSLSPVEVEFLDKKYGGIFDSSVMEWKMRGGVPKSWRGLSDQHLLALVVYLNGTKSNIVLNALFDNKNFGMATPTKEFREMVRAGVRELIQSAGYTEAEINEKTWSNLAAETVYKITFHKNP